MQLRVVQPHWPLWRRCKVLNPFRRASTLCYGCGRMTCVAAVQR